jgi:hypothetical protein
MTSTTAYKKTERSVRTKYQQHQLYTNPFDSCEGPPTSPTQHSNMQLLTVRGPITFSRRYSLTPFLDSVYYRCTLQHCSRSTRERRHCKGSCNCACRSRWQQAHRWSSISIRHNLPFVHMCGSQHCSSAPCSTSMTQKTDYFQ